jgi:hypothetical protein
VNEVLSYNSGRSAIQAASSVGHLDVVNWLFNAGANVNGKPAKCNG